MPELPDITVYIEALRERVLDKNLVAIRIANPFLLRSTEPAIGTAAGRRVVDLRRLGKRICIGLEGDLWLVIHLMIAGRLHWKTGAVKLGSRNILAAFDFEGGTLTLTEAGSQRRASLHLAQGEAALRALDPGGLDILGISLEDFAAALCRENHTIKRSLTDPRLFSGIGNAYSDEILHRAKLSPIALTQKLSGAQIETLLLATKEVLNEWIALLRVEAAGKFPEKVTAFRAEMAAHGKFRQPCPVCGAKIQRIRYASNETNYCPNCQTGGKVLADRALSRLLGADWATRCMAQN